MDFLAAVNISIVDKAMRRCKVIGTNSFAGNIYVEANIPGGESTIYCATQSKASFTDDLMDGAYSAFTCSVGNTSADLDVKYIVYLETDGILYKVPQPMFSVKVSEDKKTMQLKLVCDEDYSQVYFPLWTATDGQDDIAWYEAEKTDDRVWQCSLDVEKHGGADTYLVHVYGMADGVTDMTFITAQSVVISD